MKVLITGHEGFIGSNIVRLLSDEFEFVLYEGDIRDWKVIDKPDVILHLAALAGPRSSFQIPFEYWDVNVTASKRIFEWCEENDVRCVYASSSSIYEYWQNPYAITKKAMEEVACKNSLGMRFHTVYGRNSRPDMFYDMLLNDKVNYVTRHLRDWTHIEDLASAIRILLKTDISGFIDIGSGAPVSVIDVANAAGYEGLEIREVTGERDITHADISIMKSLGWNPTHNILEDVKYGR